jgi:phosphoglycerate dehydrogenase-like enzyme
MKRILYGGGLPPADAPDTERYLNSHGIEMVQRLLGRHQTEAELMVNLKDIDGSIAGGEPYTAAVLDSAPKLRVISRVGVGYDTIDIPAATARGIYVTVTPIPELSIAIAEHAMALMLSMTKKIPQRNTEVRAGVWDSAGASKLQDVYGLTLGLLGVGRIGAEVAKRAKGFDMKIIYYDVVRRPDLEESLGLRYVSLDELLSSSDVISVHTPLTPQTRGLLGDANIRKMKRNAVLVNTARGPIVDDNAVAAALREGRIFGAALDVLSEEPPSERHVFYRAGSGYPNLILTPHVGISERTMKAMVMAAADEAQRVVNGEKPRYPVNTLAK